MWGSDEFGGLLLAAVQGALPYIGAAVIAGALILAVVWGIKLAVDVMRNVGESRDAAIYDDWNDTAREVVNDHFTEAFNEGRTWEADFFASYAVAREFGEGHDEAIATSKDYADRRSTQS